MLAYVFWHWKAPEISIGAYENALIDFQKSLQAAWPQGFEGSAVARISKAPWLGATDGYEEWYLLEGFEALGILNEAAVSAGCKAPHDEAARMAAGGCAGLYKLWSGVSSIAGARMAGWFSKPAGTTYERLQAAVSGPIASAQGSLWGRQLVLGPTPEFCVLGPRELTLPEDIRVMWLPRQVVWPAAPL